MPELLEFTVQTFTANELNIKVKNSGVASLEKTLVIEIYPPTYLVSAAVNEAAINAANNDTPPGAMRLDGVVSGPDGWSIWARRESSDSSLIIVLINDRDQNTGDLKPLIKFPAGAESIIRIPLNPQANHDRIDLLYSYTHGDPEARIDGKLELKSSDVGDWTPRVDLRSDQQNPTMIKAGESATISWEISDGVSAVLRGPLPGDNSELTLSSEPDADFKIAKGSLSIRVVGLMNYLLQAEVKRAGHPNVQIWKMLTLDTSNKKHIYIGPRQGKVLPYGLIELDWAAWGVPQVLITAADTTRVIKLTQQTFGGSFEGSGVMRVSASKAGTETVLIEAKPDGSRTKSVLVVSWQHMVKPDIAGHPWGMAVIAPKLALLTFQGLYVAEVGRIDPQSALQKLMFVKKTAATPPTEWIALTALGNRFLCLRRTDPNPDLELAPYTPDGNPDVIPPLSLHADLRRMAAHSKAVFDFVGFGGRAYVVVEAPLDGSTARRAYSVGFNSSTNKAEYRAEPLLENLFGFRLVTFDDALYALSRESGQMFRFGLTKAGRLEPAAQAASAVTKEDGKSMIRDGLIVPVGRVLVVLNPTSVPSLKSLEEYDLHNVLPQEKDESPTNTIPQDLVYNPQKNYWARCGRGLEIKPDAVAAFRDGDSPRLWVVQPDGETHTLAVGSESLFLRDYVLDFPTKPLSPYLNKKRKFTIKHSTAFGPIAERYRKLGIADIVATGPREISPLPTRPQVQFDVEISYNEANPSPVTLRLQLARRPQARPDVDYLLEVTFSGPDLSTASSCLRRLRAVEATLLLSNDEVFGSRTQHSPDSIIEVPRPARFDEHLRFVIVNASEQFRLKPQPALMGANYILEEFFVPINHESQDFLLKADGKIQTQGVIEVNFNFALPHGIEVSSVPQPQTKLIRLNNSNAQKMQVMLVKTLMPGDAPLKLQGTKQLIEPMADRPVFVCQLDYKI